MTADSDEPSAGDPSGTDPARDVWMPTLLHPTAAESSSVGSPAPAPPGSDVTWHAAPAPPWRTPGQPRLVALEGGRTERDREVAELRSAATLANQRLGRLRGLLRSFEQQLFAAHSEAAARGEAARRAEKRIAALETELAAAHEEIGRLRARAQAQPARVMAHIDHHHRLLLASLRSDPALVVDHTAPGAADR